MRLYFHFSYLPYFISTKPKRRNLAKHPRYDPLNPNTDQFPNKFIFNFFYLITINKGKTLFPTSCHEPNFPLESEHLQRVNHGTQVPKKPSIKKLPTVGPRNPILIPQFSQSTRCFLSFVQMCSIFSHNLARPLVQKSNYAHILLLPSDFAVCKWPLHYPTI